MRLQVTHDGAVSLEIHNVAPYFDIDLFITDLFSIPIFALRPLGCLRN